MMTPKTMPILFMTAFLMFVIATFSWVPDDFVVTRILGIAFAITYIFFQLNKETFRKKKPFFKLFFLTSVVGLFIGISIDHVFMNSGLRAQDYFILVIVLLAMTKMYEDFYVAPH